MPSEAAADILGIGGKLLWNIAKVLIIVAVAVGLYFFTRWIQKGTKKQKAFTINVNIVDMNGVVVFDKLGFMKSDKTGLLEMQFQKRKNDSIPPIPRHLIKGGECALLNYAPGHYAAIDTYETIKNIENGVQKIVLINLGMKKYLINKQREILNRIEDKRKKWEERAPWITLCVGVVAAMLLAAFFIWVAPNMIDRLIAERVQECIAAGW